MFLHVCLHRIGAAERRDRSSSVGGDIIHSELDEHFDVFPDFASLFGGELFVTPQKIVFAIS